MSGRRIEKTARRQMQRFLTSLSGGDDDGNLSGRDASAFLPSLDGRRVLVTEGAGHLAQPAKISDDRVDCVAHPAIHTHCAYKVNVEDVWPTYDNPQDA